MAQTLPRLLQNSVQSFKKLGSCNMLKKEDLYGRQYEWRVLGVCHTLADDFQYGCLRLDWLRLWGLVLGVYFSFALFFAALTIRLLHAEHEHFTGELLPTMSLFEQAFWLSMGHLISVGFGHLQPISTSANILVTAEFLLGILLSAMLLGAVVSKATLPSVRLVFSKKCLLMRRNGVRHFMFRVGNTRGNLLVAPDVRLSSFTHVETEEGESIWVAEPLEVVEPPVMAPAFNVVHKIDESSPLFSQSDEELLKKDYSISLTATDNHTFQTLYVAKYYTGETDCLTDVRFSDVLKREGNVRIMDLSKFNNVEPYRSRAVADKHW